MTVVTVITVSAVGVLLVWVLFEDQLWNLRSKITAAFARKKVNPSEQAVIIYLRGASLPHEVYEKYDVSTLEDQLRETIQRKGLGEYDGNEFGPDETVLYMYGPDAEHLFAGVESVLRAYPLCKEGTAVIRRGPPGAPQREVTLA
jgi:hypothetical protein